MPRLEICDAFGSISLAELTEEKVKAAGLDDKQTEALSVLIDAFEAHAVAATRKAAAIKNVRELMDVEAAAQAAVLASSPPPTFQQIHAANAAAYRKG